MDNATQAARELGARRLTPGLLSQWTPAFIVILGAVASLAMFAREYIAPSDYIGWRQQLAMAGCAGLMAVGAAWEVAAGRRALAESLRFWCVAALVGLIVCAMGLYRFESKAFYAFVAPLALCGFIINHYLPAAWRRLFFVGVAGLALTCLFGVASPPAALFLAGAGLALIGICHLPAPLWARLALLAACAGALAALRLGWLYQGWMAAALPILASIFMFRLAVYLYDLETGKGPKNFLRGIAYFFMFPNLAFPFFPVVDFTAFNRSYYNDDAIRIYARGASYMFRGLIHLLLYRVVYTYLVLVPDQIHDTATFLQHIVSNFALYLRISGLFHLIVGLLVLFGYNLPETHSRFYFSNSIVDFWRRINIFWKDFMQKMVFNPSYLRIKRLGVSHFASMLLSVAIVFIATWALHAYQWFWLSGTFLLTLPDMLFWAFLAALMMAQMTLEARPKRKSLHGFIGPRALLVVRTICTFLTICLLWSFWTSPTADDWFAIVARSGLAPALSAPTAASAAQWAQTFASISLVAVMTAVSVGATFGLAKPAAAPARKPAAKPAPRASAFYATAAAGVASLCALIAVQARPISAALGIESYATTLADNSLNQASIAMMNRGYYEGLATAGRFNPELWEFFTNGPNNRTHLEPHAHGEAGFRFREDYIDREFAPGETATVAGISFPINRWGMHDQDYALEKPPGTFRIALIGDSRSMGWGVEYAERFEVLLEDRLNREHAGGAHQAYEILNFSQYGYHPIERLMVLEEKALNFTPDAVIYVAGLLDNDFIHHAQMVRRGVAMPFDFVADINRRAGISASMGEAEIARRMEPFADELNQNVYANMMARARERGIQMIWLEIPSLSDKPERVAAIHRHAQEAGFATIPMTGVYDPGTYRISRWDGHPSPAGHAFLADALYQNLLRLEHGGRLAMGLRHASGSR